MSYTFRIPESCATYISQSAICRYRGQTEETLGKLKSKIKLIHIVTLRLNVSSENSDTSQTETIFSVWDVEREHQISRWVQRCFFATHVGYWRYCNLPVNFNQSGQTPLTSLNNMSTHRTVSHLIFISLTILSHLKNLLCEKKTQDWAAATWMFRCSL